MTSSHKNAPGRREITQERRRSRRTRQLRVGAVAAAGALVFFGVAGASVQNDQLRAGLVSLASPISGATSDDSSDQTPAPTETAGPGDESGAGAEAEAAAAAKASEENRAADEDRAAEEARVAEAAAAEEARVAEAAAAEAKAAEEQARVAAEQEAAAQAAADAAAAARAAEEAAAAEAAAASVPVDDPAGAKAYAASALAGHGWAASEMTCLNTLWEKESNWMTSATNVSSGAYGIVQSLPAEKMASSGPDYLTSYKTQINWGLGYIESRYGSPCGALNFHYANNWY
ncbi:aggregation-promoting factor C-terminal-like domain-containing protein [Arthrobacter sp. Z1-15]